MESIITTVILGFVVLTVLILGVVVWKSLRKKAFSDGDMKFIQEQWQKIMVMSKQDPRHAVMDADKLLDHVLKKKGYEGHLGEKLKKAASLFSDLNGVWSAHKMRNKLAHELGIEISAKQCAQVMSQFRRALRDLGAKI